jgi:hypothetical protein
MPGSVNSMDPSNMGPLLRHFCRCRATMKRHILTESGAGISPG